MSEMFNVCILKCIADLESYDISLFTLGRRGIDIDKSEKSKLNL